MPLVGGTTKEYLATRQELPVLVLGGVDDQVIAPKVHHLHVQALRLSAEPVTDAFHTGLAHPSHDGQGLDRGEQINNAIRLIPVQELLEQRVLIGELALDRLHQPLSGHPGVLLRPKEVGDEGGGEELDYLPPQADRPARVIHGNRPAVSVFPLMPNELQLVAGILLLVPTLEATHVQDQREGIDLALMVEVKTERAVVLTVGGEGGHTDGDELLPSGPAPIRARCNDGSSPLRANPRELLESCLTCLIHPSQRLFIRPVQAGAVGALHGSLNCLAERLVPAVVGQDGLLARDIDHDLSR